MAAISSTLWTLLQAGDQVVIDHTVYGNSFVLFVRGLPSFGVKVVVEEDVRSSECPLECGSRLSNFRSGSMLSKKGLRDGLNDDFC